MGTSSLTVSKGEGPGVIVFLISKNTGVSSPSRLAPERVLVAQVGEDRTVEQPARDCSYLLSIAVERPARLSVTSAGVPAML